MRTRTFGLIAVNALAVGLIVLGVVAGSASSSLLIQIPGGLGSTVIGSLLILRVPGNRVGPLLAFLGVLLIAVDVVHILVGEHGAEGIGAVAAIGESSLFVLQMAALAIMIMIFPTGSARWRWLSVGATVVGTLGFLGGVAWALSMPSPELVASLHEVDGGNPAEVAAALLFFGFPFALASLVARYRAAATVERAQIRWLLFAATAILVAVVVPNVTGDFESLPVTLLFSVAAAAIPAAIGVAITRYRLYTIDRIVSRTVTYGAVAAVLATVFGLLALLPTTLLGSSDGKQELPAWFVALSTLVVFALFSPVRARVQRWVERRFNRARYDAEVVVGAFARRVRDETDLGEVAAELGDIAATVVEPSFVGLWLRQA